MTHDIWIEADGTIRFIHDDDVKELFDDSDLKTSRASHVEPAENGGWTADMSPVGGPVLGPYARRDEALAAEVQYLDALLALGSDSQTH